MSRGAGKASAGAGQSCTGSPLVVRRPILLGCVAVTGIVSLVAIFLPRFGAPAPFDDVATDGVTEGLGTLGLSLVGLVAALFAFAELPAVRGVLDRDARRLPRRDEQHTVMLALSVLAVVAIALRLVTTPSGTTVLTTGVVSYGPRIGVWIGLAAAVTQLLCLAVLLPLLEAKAEARLGRVPAASPAPPLVDLRVPASPNVANPRATPLGRRARRSRR